MVSVEARKQLEAIRLFHQLAAKHGTLDRSVRELSLK
jgi:hypothetical protein